MFKGRGIFSVDMPGRATICNYEVAYAEMAKDKNRENEALEWAEVTFKDVDYETM